MTFELSAAGYSGATGLKHSMNSRKKRLLWGEPNTLIARSLQIAFDYRARNEKTWQDDYNLTALENSAGRIDTRGFQSQTMINACLSQKLSGSHDNRLRQCTGRSEISVSKHGARSTTQIVAILI